MNTIRKHFITKHYYNNREERLLFVKKNFPYLLRHSILDVGCSRKELKKFLDKRVIYLGLDKNEFADLRIDLDVEEIPIENSSFYTVICTDVLEHLENIHDVLLKILLVAERYVLISLPNCWSGIKAKIFFLKKQRSGKFYGLPIKKPHDRHRWFFNFVEAENFVCSIAQKYAKQIDVYPYFNPTNKFIKRVAKATLPEEAFLNLFSKAVWILIEKKKIEK